MKIRCFLNILLLFLVVFFTSQATAQQSKVDSVILLLNTVIMNDEPDTAIFFATMDFLYQSTQNKDMTAEQIELLEVTSLQFENWEKDIWPFNLHILMVTSLMDEYPKKAIDIGTLQLDKLDQYNTPGAIEAKRVLLSTLRFPYRNSDYLEDGLVYYSKKFNQYKIQGDSSLIAACYFVLSGFYKISGLNELAIYNMKKSISYLDSIRDRRAWINNIGVLGSYYILQGEKSKGLKYSKVALSQLLSLNQVPSYVALNIAVVMLEDNQTDSAAYYIDVAKQGIDKSDIDMAASILQFESLYYIHIGDLEAAEDNLKECWQMIRTKNIGVTPGAGTMAPDYYLALIRIEQNRLDEAIDLLKSDITRLNNVREDILRDYKLMAQLYQQTGQNELAAETYAQFIAMQDSLLADQEKLRVIGFEAEQSMNESALSIEKLKSKSRISSQARNFSIGIAALLLILTATIYFRYQSKKKANNVLNETLTNLKSTQSQLIQSEKMASLGELTAGIAHEIQNPLNFVNNFSEVNEELLVEMKEELENGNTEDAKAIANDAIENQQKILHHGKRADDIVKGMLQHSRSSSGEKEPTDINALADEYLRLAYHGLRAKDKSFNATMNTDFDETIASIKVIPQDIGRVILNLITNAFYAVNEKQKLLAKDLPGFENLVGLAKYEPTVSVSTKKEGDKVLISVKDNGNGIPQSALDKIFQPFFTTKPTGQGTGLGLSMSYDIVTKSHDGELTVETKEDEGTEFIIILSK